MFIPDTLWSKIRGQFNEDEKVALRFAKSGDTICPPGVTLSPSKLPADLRQKLETAVKAARGQNYERVREPGRPE